MKLNSAFSWQLFAIFAVLLSVLLFASNRIEYLNFKKVLRLEIASYATALIGHKVEIQDISLSADLGLHFHNITVENPEGFSDGQLLRIQELAIFPDFQAVMRGRLHIKNITIFSPAIRLMRGPKGQLNISEKLKQFLLKKSTGTYQVDTLSIRLGSFGMDEKKSLAFTGMSLELNDISSRSDAKTLIKGNLVNAGENYLLLDGWSYLKNVPLRFALTLSSPRFRPASLSSASQAGPLATMMMTVQLALEGDLEAGIHISSHISLHNESALHPLIERSGIFWGKDGLRTWELDAHAFYDIRKQLLAVNEATLWTGALTAAQIKGRISNFGEGFSYSATAKITGLDLASVIISKDFQVRGTITSDSLSIKGAIADTVPSFSGSFLIEDAAFKSGDLDLDNIRGKLYLSSTSGKTLVVNARVSAGVHKIKDVVFKKSPALLIALASQGTLDKLNLHGSASLAPTSLTIQNSDMAFINTANLTIDGTLRSIKKADTFSGYGSLEIGELMYHDFHVSSLKSSTEFDFARNAISFTSLNLEANEIHSFVDNVTIELFADGRNYAADLRGVNISFPPAKTEIKKGALRISISQSNKVLTVNGTFSTGNIFLHDYFLGSVAGDCRFDGTNFYLEHVGGTLASGTISLTGQGKAQGRLFPLRITANADDVDLSKIAGLYSKFRPLPYVISGRLRQGMFDGSIEGTDDLKGTAFLNTPNLTVSAERGKRSLVRDWSLSTSIYLKGKDLDFSVDAQKKGVAAKVSGTIRDFTEVKRTAEIYVSLPLVQLRLLREAIWDNFPYSILYAGLDGVVSSEIAFAYDRAVADVVGTLVLNDVYLKGENGEYEIGPVNGTVPIVYGSRKGEHEGTRMPIFERSKFETLSGEYSRQFPGEGYNRITIGSAGYGFRMLDNITLWVKRKGSLLDVGRFSANIFGGTISGAAFAAPGSKMSYQIGLIAKGLSLTSLCNDIEPIRGYISGKLDGIATFKGTGMDLSGFLGKADFWAYVDKGEKTKISKEFLQKVGGASMKSYMSDRNYDTGLLSVYINKGDIYFDKLEISNRNIFGIKDLSVAVAPYNNRITIDALMWSLTEAARRARSKSQ